MKKSILNIIGLLVATAVLNSCNKQLADLQPTDIIQPDKALTNVLELQKGVFGVYAANGMSSNRVYIGSILADETKIASTNRGFGLLSFKWEYSSSPEQEYNSDFAGYYTMIDDDNKILAVIDNVATYSPAEAALKSRIKGELLGLRGFAHFELLTEFMPSGYSAGALGVPIVLKSDLFAQPARSKVGDVITQISQDLAAARAETNIPVAPDDLSRLSQAAIAGIQARVSLLTRDWAGVVKNARDALDMSQVHLATGNDFFDYWADMSETESVWKYRNAAPQLYWTDTNGDIFFNPSDELTTDYDQANDIRFAAYFSGTQIVKYPGSSTGPQTNDIKLVRAAELYLDLAEGYAQQNQLVQAGLYLDSVRQARVFGYTTGSFVSQQDAIQQILDERYKELCYEGFRFFDLKRYSAPINRFPTDVQNPLWQNLPANNFHFALPIPQHEMFANANMVQNPGY